jgi:hypothetical protein
MAKRLQVNTLLATRDGRDIGNAIVTVVLYQVKTDDGKLSILSREEIEALFHIGTVANF